MTRRRVLLKFSDENAKRVLDGRKNITIRLGLEVGEIPAGSRFILAREGGEPFGTANAAWSQSVLLEDVPDLLDRNQQWWLHRRYGSVEELRRELCSYYPDRTIFRDTRVTVLKWDDFKSIEDGEEALDLALDAILGVGIDRDALDVLEVLIGLPDYDVEALYHGVKLSAEVRS